MGKEFVLLIRWNKKARPTTKKQIKRVIEDLEGIVNCTAYALQADSSFLDGLLT